MPPVSRNALIAGGVVLLHVAALWALQSGLLRRAAEVVVPVALLSSLVTPQTPPAPVVTPQPEPETPAAAPVVRKSPPPPAPSPAPRPVALPDRAPAPAAVTGSTEPQAAPPPVAAPVSPAPAAPPMAAVPAPAAAAKVELPTTRADYLHNPQPDYPRVSFRLGEEGLVVMRVLIGPDGRPQDAQLAKSSGYPRLDQAAEATVRGWRYVPGKRGGVPEAMWVDVPIRWEIKKD